ncbi:MAG: arylsulfatase [Pirellulales bacterium]
MKNCVAVAIVLLFPHWYSLAASEVVRTKPNILIVLADDLGFGDMQANNKDLGKIPTPNMDKLASEGVRFTDAHSSSGCCSPSRYTLLTGRYHWRTRLQSGIVGVWGKPLIAQDRLTIASMAKTQGYKTACIGKWHLGNQWAIPTDLESNFVGFGGKAGGGGEVTTIATDENRRAWQQVFSQRITGGPTERGFDHYFGTDVPNWPPYCFIDGDKTVGIPDELLPASKFVKNLSSLQGPALSDWKLENVLPALIQRAEQFIEVQAHANQPFLLYLPLTSPHTPLSVNEQFKGKSGLKGDYGDFVVETDAALGRVMAAVQRAGIEENTLVIFTSDNGCASYIGVKEMEAEGHYPSGNLRDYKASVYEGGHRVPFIVKWPGVTPKGTVCDQLVHHADVMATLAELLEFKLPDNAAEDSFSMMPLLRGEAQSIRTHAISTACAGTPSLREGPWKLVLESEKDSTASVQLFNLNEDIGESNNLATKYPDRVKSMQETLEQIIVKGRSTPGQPQKNDIKVVRYPKSASKKS